MDLPSLAERAGMGNRVDHDSMQPFAESLSAAQARFKPMLGIGKHSCRPYPAVDAAGDFSGGLKPTGSWRSDCDDAGQAQMYVRSESVTFADVTAAHMYAWYAPKSQFVRGEHASKPSTWFHGIGGGHRHDWQNVVVFTSDATAGATVMKTCVSIEDEYRCFHTPATAVYGAAERLTFCYAFEQDRDIPAHRAAPWGGFGSCLGWEEVDVIDPPTIDWGALSGEAQATLNADPFGGLAKVSINDNNFHSAVETAWKAPWYGFDLKPYGLVANLGNGMPTAGD